MRPGDRLRVEMMRATARFAVSYGDAYARRLRASGVRAVHDVTPDVDHYFLTEDPVRARSTMAMVAGEIRDAMPAHA